ncbi:hypothetical protein IAQ61_011742 [Plenodomus lingam]|uniref:Similar to cyanovirin-N family protein n=1 Tax=Leptosphaeria maculans (strain JN3 / isolate v23.1.3 / race Av1-4-5-6-7-8) TaxID=985895 RepID=E5AAZ0_LEPMJ|nr:similar to cyanovirin-N family protein [Plenodomus lingam JN3]KAH9859959.1 hypothetical protein IAQ61_011742 [Plenodomus lingam]CBY00831.1 similar to cyanovirin-N family protein [Plenodomus lingam JN3]
MTFQHSAEDIRIDDGHILRARLRNAEGELNDSEIDLNNHIGNVDGNFVWDGENFSHSAQDIEFTIEADGEAAVLRASLSDAEGNHETRDINLGERISNNDGNFEYN